MAMDIQEIKQLLIRANKAGYGNEATKIVSEKDNSKTITYSEGDWEFHDNYFGGEPFGGREVIFHQNKPLWMMVYYGGINTSIDFYKVYGFLKKALLNSPEEMPVRGPEKLEDGDWLYLNKITGDFDSFFGEETISFQDEVIYLTKYQGGLVDK
ncbi:MAG TPA: DUF5680 domain-containing protein [Candidatus Saccharimonadales bacterium]|nr:DUF5680 domain-containing protein [Candidatus Saccharimonadales bacterium]